MLSAETRFSGSSPAADVVSALERTAENEMDKPMMTGGLPAKRIIVRRGSKRRAFTLLKPPYPDEGDQVKLSDGLEYEVISIEDTRAWVLPAVKPKSK